MRGRGNGTQPMTIVDGIRFYKTEQGYWLGAVRETPIRLHRYVWEKENGPVPDGYHVHHVDGNPDNNEIANLCLLTASEHSSFHAGQEKNKQKARESIKVASQAARAWHKSETGREWHQEQWERTLRVAMTEQVEKTCEVCGKPYQTCKVTAYKSKYCCNNCKATAFRRRRREQAYAH